LQEGFRPEARESYPSLDMLLQAGYTTILLETDWVDSHYRALLSLAALPRITAGGFCVDFDGVPRLELPPRPANHAGKPQAAPSK
jgi:hypothetical protein